MLFIYPMWDHESQRIGKQKCTPIGYMLHGIAELLGFIGLLLLFACGAYISYRLYAGTYHGSLFWLMAIPFVLGFIGQILYQISWRLAAKKGFHYDGVTCEASWTEDGQRQTYNSTTSPAKSTPCRQNRHAK